MDKVLKLWQMKKSMKVNGRMTCATVRVFYVFWKTAKPLRPTKDNLTTENFRVLVVTHILMVTFMRAHLNMRRSKEKASTPALMAQYMRVIIKMRCAMDTVY